MSTETRTTYTIVPATAHDGRDKVRTALLYEQLGWLRDAVRKALDS